MKITILAERAPNAGHKVIATVEDHADTKTVVEALVRSNRYYSLQAWSGWSKRAALKKPTCLVSWAQGMGSAFSHS